MLLGSFWDASDLLFKSYGHFKKIIYFGNHHWDSTDKVLFCQNKRLMAKIESTFLPFRFSKSTTLLTTLARSILHMIYLPPLPPYRPCLFDVIQFQLNQGQSAVWLPCFRLELAHENGIKNSNRVLEVGGPWDSRSPKGRVLFEGNEPNVCYFVTKL